MILLILKTIIHDFAWVSLNPCIKLKVNVFQYSYFNCDSIMNL